MKVKEESERVGLKLNIQKMKIMASGPITSLQIHRETVETMTDFILGGSKMTADTKGTFHAMIGLIKDRNGMDLTEAEDIKKRWH